MDKMKYIFASAGAVLVGFLGGWDKMLHALFTLTILDIITGIMLAAARHEVSSNIALQGFAKKVGIYVLVGVAVSLDSILGTVPHLRGVTIGFFIGVEGLSILENWGGYGLPLPKKLKSMLKQLRDENEGGA